MSNNIPRPINSGRVSFTVKIDGSELKTSYLIFSINVWLEFNKISTAEIVLLDGNVKVGFELSDSEELIIGNELEIEVGYNGENETIFKGVIVKHAVKFDNKISHLVITAKHKAYKMSKVRNNAVFSEATDSDIIDQIIKKSQLSAEVDATSIKHETLTQYNCTDWDFINLRAEANAQLVYTDIDKIVVKKPDLASEPKLEINNEYTILDFEAEIDGRTSYKKYNALSWNYVEQDLFDVTKDTGECDTEQGNLTTGNLASALDNDTYNINIGSCLNDESAVTSIVDASILKNSLSKIIGKINVFGVADIRPGDMISLTDIGNRFNGKTLVSSVKQVIDENSWITVIHFGFDETAYAQKYDDINSYPANGFMPAVSGLQVAKVVKLEGDPLGEDRIQIKLPNFTSGASEFWARIATLDAGKERGTFFLPEVDDEVIAGFINDDPNNAVILGMLNSSGLPAPIKAEDANNTKGIYTREKIKLEFNDEVKSVLIETPGGNKLILSDDAKGFSVEDQNGNKIVLDDNGITIESAKALNLKAKNDVVLEGNNVNIKAKMALKAEGSSSAEVSTSGNAVLKGSIVQIN